ncbi:MAG: Verru_Chthon cassette protein A [Chthoniobacter sp.]|nr:Verru_Chthon cassette protein A [Chthoniobacter sp.]
MKQSRQLQQAGIALVIVLAFLVLISVVVIAFFTSVSTELTASRTVAISASTQQLADSAVNVVMAQLVDATKGQDSGSLLAWASQPGLIRTFDAAGKPRDFFKLYSSDKMTVSGGGFTGAPDLPPADWKSSANSDLYTDLNAPAPDFTGALVYPIVDPSAEVLANGQVPSFGQLKVDGFSITSRPGYEAGKAESAGNNRAPMPVKWLYVLRDGTLQPPALQLGVLTVKAATTTNPIVGRIAFWTDDETSKVNINTASEGTYWDVPRIFSMEDIGKYASATTVSSPGMAICQPAQHEYQRYPGHPATTCLSPIFKNLLPVPYPDPINSSNITQLDPYYDIAPRIGLPLSSGGGGGGSKGGTELPSSEVTVDRDRLYASVDELMFTPDLTSDARIPNTSSGSKSPNLISKAALEKARFFITAHSSAPETTLYNTPRVAIWPVWVSASQRTVYDSMMAFCSTIGGKEYFFTRANPRSATQDLSPRNLQLYQYLQALTKNNVPGFGGNFLQKYGAGTTGITDRDQILTSIYDYIRCVNLADTSNSASPFTPPFDAPNLGIDKLDLYRPGAGEVVPIKIGQTKGFGRFASVAEADVLFYGTGAGRMKAVFLMEFATPLHGLGGMRVGLKYTVTGLDKFKVAPKDASGGATPQPLGLPAEGTNIMENTDLQTNGGRSVGGTEGPSMAFSNKWNNTKKLITAGGPEAIGNYPFFTQNDFVFTPQATSSFVFKGGKIKVEIRTTDTNELIQTVNLEFPDGEFKTPGTGASDFNARIAGGGGATFVVRGEDTVVGLEPAGVKGNTADGELDPTAGDTRMVEALPEVPATLFRAHKKYSEPGVQQAYGLAWSTGQPFPGATYGKLVPVPRYMNGGLRLPDVPSRVGDHVTRSDGQPGDWDTGVGDQKDGAHINKSDEGDARFNGRLPYVLGNFTEYAPPGQTHFSPNRQMPSALMFGSIPTGVQRFKPWQTLLFNPRPEDLTHPGFGTPRVPAAGQPFTLPPDHLLADLFWMPVIEPYAISQPFATSGKINMNYQIQPFTYIRRSTGMYAVMQATKFMALELNDAQTYKPLDPGNGGSRMPDRRFAIDIPETLKAFDTKFSGNDLFKSATQFCDINLIPPGETASTIASFWSNHQLTGDNLREKPYVDIYPRLTTKSNTYTVHVRVQTLKKASASVPDQWIPARDKVVGEYRGSVLLERYIDLNDPALPDFAAKFVANPSDSTLNIDQYYRMRVVSKKRFAP